MRRADDDGWLRWDGEQGDRTEVFCRDPLRAEGTDPGVAMSGVLEVQLSFCVGYQVYLGYRSQPPFCLRFLIFFFSVSTRG